MQKSNKDVFLVCQINTINEWYDEEYKGPDKEAMRAYHAKALEYLYKPERFKTPGHPTKDERKEFMDGVMEAVRKTAGQHMESHDLMSMSVLKL